jgi:hypothetical protein
MTFRWLLVTFVVMSFLCSAQERQTLKPKAIGKLLPLKVQGYSVKGDSKSTILTIGTLRYSMCERVFSHRDRTIKVLLFDYAEAPIMLNQSVKKWQEMPAIQNDSVVFKPVTSAYGPQWESSHPQANRSQLLTSINNRFFLTLEAEGMSMEELRIFFKCIDLSKFPE